MAALKPAGPMNWICSSKYVVLMYGRFILVDECEISKSLLLFNYKTTSPEAHSRKAGGKDRGSFMKAVEARLWHLSNSLAD